jgi:hypothetical protein
MSNIVPVRSSDVETSRPGAAVTRGTQRALVRIGEKALVRQAEVMAESVVSQHKLREVDRLAEEAMTGHAMLSRWAAVLAGDDLILADELRFFKDTARLGNGQVLADAIDQFRDI